MAPILLQQFLQVGKWRIVAFLAVTAVLDVQVLATFDAQTFAFGIVQGLDGNFQQGILPDQGSKVNVGVIGHEQF